MPRASQTPEQLLRHAGWMRSLARRLASSDAEADDLVQETWLRWVQSPPRQVGAMRSWLATVLKRLAIRQRRDRAARSRREEQVASPPTNEFTPDSLLERVELERRLVDLVLELEEPLRKTVLARFFEDLSPSKIAERDAVDVTTVRWRLRRGFEKIRQKLDSEHDGDREAWCAVFLGTSSIGALNYGATSTAATASTGTNGTMTLGGWLMSAKTTMTAAAATCLVGGLCLFWMLSADKPGSTEDERSENNMTSDEVEIERDAGEIASVVKSTSVDSRKPDIAPENGDEASEKVAVVLEPPGRLGGIVRTRSAPIEAARIELHSATDQEPRPAPRNLRVPLASTETDAMGEFLFESIAPGEYWASVQAKGRRSRQIEKIEIRSEEITELDLELVRGFSVDGIVSDPSGMPVAGALVQTTNSMVSHGTPDGQRFSIGFPPSGGFHGEQSWLPAVTTDDRGRFEIDGLPSGNVRLIASHESWRAKELNDVAAGSQDVRIELGNARTIRGRLSDEEGEAIADAKIQLRGGIHEGRAILATSDELGEFELRGVPLEPAAFGVRAEGFMEYESDPVSPDHTATMKIVLARGHSATGRVLDGSGDPVEGATIEARNLESFGSRGSTSDADGRFELTRLELMASYSLKVKAKGFAPTRLESFEVVGSSNELPDLVLEKQSALRVIVQNENTDAPVVGAKVEVFHTRPSRGTQIESALTDDEGVAFIGQLEAGSSRITVSANGYTKLTASRELGDSEEVELRLRLGAGGRITGTTRNSAGDAIPGASITVFGQSFEGGHVSGKAQTDQNGQFAIEGLPPGKFVVSANYGYLARANAGNVEPNGAPVELTLEETAQISGQFVDDRTGEPLTRFTVGIKNSRHVSLKTGTETRHKEGRFELSDVSPGQRELFAKAPGYISATKVVELDPGESLKGLVFRLKIGGVAKGRVIDPEGQPVQGARVRLAGVDDPVAQGTFSMISKSGTGRTSLPREFRIPFRKGEVETDENGEFEIRGLPLTPSDLEVLHPSYVKRSLPQVELRSGSTTDLGDIELIQGLLLEGVAFDENGETIESGSVRIERLAADGTAEFSTSVDVKDDGTWEKTGLDPGHYRLSLLGGNGPSPEIDLNDKNLRVDLHARKDPSTGTRRALSPGN